MAERYVSNRIIFKKGEQRNFVYKAKKVLNCSWKDLAVILGVREKTLQDWGRERYKISHDAAKILSKKASIKLPNTIRILRWDDHLAKISKKGGTNKYKKYGQVYDKNLRKIAWQKWWKEDGQKRIKDFKILERKSIHIPAKSTSLAEFVGIVMGDGGVTNSAVTITLDKKVDSQYVYFVKDLIWKLFKVEPKIYHRKGVRVVNIVVSSRNLVDFCESIGLKKGNKLKLGLDIPSWIKGNKKYEIACLRGLFDTDGCVFKHSYNNNGKRYGYTKIAFTSRSGDLIKTVSEILIKLGFCVRISRNGNDVRIENQKDVQKYRDIIGFSNPKYKKYF